MALDVEFLVEALHHELATPLTIAMINLGIAADELLRASAVLPDLTEARFANDAAGEALGQALAIVHELRGMRRSQACPGRAAEPAVDVNQTIRMALRLLRPILSGRVE